MIDRAMRLPVRLGAYTEPDELDPKGHRRQHRTTGMRIDILQKHIIERPATSGGPLPPCFLAGFLLVGEFESRRWGASGMPPDRAQVPDAIMALGVIGR